MQPWAEVMELVRADADRVGGWRPMLASPAGRAIVLYRVGHWASSSPRRRHVRRVVAVITQVVSLPYGIEVPFGARIGPGLRILHTAGGVVINSKATIGRNCTITDAVTIGGRGSSDDRSGGRPTLGDDVTIGAGARIIGPIVIGDGAVIGANAAVVSDVAPGSVVVGVPAHPV